MHTKPDPIDPEVLRDMGYEKRDINVKSLSRSTFWIFLFCVACFAVSVPIYLSIQARNIAEPQKSKNRIQSPNPLLQTNITTKLDMVQLRAREEKALNSTEWVDQSKGAVRIPISRAIDLIAERGVSTGAVVAAESKGNTIPQNANDPAMSESGAAR
jgi:hypothetical protein